MASDKTNVMRVLEQHKIAYKPHEYPHGFCDKIVPRNQLRETLEKLLKLHCGSKSKKWQVWRRD